MAQSFRQPVTHVSTDKSVIEGKLSDHGWPLFETAHGPILSANIMCSGENYDPHNANSFLQHPERWAERYQGLVQALHRNATEAMERHNQHPIIAIQEFPRRNAHFNIQASVLHALLLSKFPESDGWSILFGQKDEETHDYAQLCVIVPPQYHPCQLSLPVEAQKYCTEGQYGPNRFQVIQLGDRVGLNRFALINIHPGPGGSVLQIIGEAAVQLLKSNGVDAVHVVGDWNRSADKATVAFEHSRLLRWSQVESSQPSSHLSGASRQKFDAYGMPTELSPFPIDLHVTISAGPEMTVLKESKH